MAKTGGGGPPSNVDRSGSGYHRLMRSESHPWSEGHCVRRDGKWYFERLDGSRIFIEDESLVLDSDHLEFLVKEQLKKTELVGLN